MIISILILMDVVVSTWVGQFTMGNDVIPSKVHVADEHPTVLNPVNDSNVSVVAT